MVCAQGLQVLAFVINAAGNGGDLEAEGLQQLYRDGTHAARGAGDQHVALARAVGEQLVDADGGGVAGGADGSGVGSSEALRNWQRGLGVDTLLRGVAAVAELAESVAECGHQRAHR